MLGKMTINITINSKTITTDTEGFQTEATSQVWTGRACKDRKNAHKAWVSGAIFADATDLFTIRKTSTVIKDNMTITCNNNEYVILSVEPVERMYLEILAKAVIPSGENQL